MATSARVSPATASAGLALVEPQLRELGALAGPAAALPDWSRAIRARSAGQFQSSLRGRGMEYDESRPYQQGDDIRHLDWRVTARTGRPHTKLFREERERPILICVDYRHAMFFATRGVFKAVQAARAAALLAWRAQQNGDRVGGLLFTDAGFRELPPRRGKPAIMQWLKLLADEAPRQRAAAAAPHTTHSLHDALVRLRRVVKPGTLVFVVSDFRGFDDATSAELAQLAQHSDVGLVAVHDPLEARFPNLDTAATLGDGRRTLRVDGASGNERDAYAAQFEARREAVRALCRTHRLLFAPLETTADPVAALVRMLGG